MGTNGPTDGTFRRWKPPKIVVRHGLVARFLRTRRRTGRLREWLPVGLIVCSVLSVLVVRGGPWLVRQLPPSVRQMGEEAVRRLHAPVRGAAACPSKVPVRQMGVEAVQRLHASVRGAAACPSKMLERQTEQKDVLGCAQAVPEVVAQSPAQIVESRARSAPRVDSACVPPEHYGVRVADPDHATWCMLTHDAEVRHIDGDVWKTLPGGTYFIVERRMRDRAGRLVLSGYIPPKNLLVRPPLLLPVEDVKAFSGTPERLPPRQLEALRRFYECAGEIERLRTALLRANGEKCPHLARAVAATRAFREKAAAFERLPGGPQTLSDDERRTWTYELTRLRTAAQEANRAYRGWKAAHAGELKTLEENEDYRRLRDDQRACAAQVPGLAFVPE